MIASTTQIEPKSFRATLLLLLHIVRVRKQLKTTKGLLKMEFGKGWKTLTVWESLDDLKAFRNCGAHLDAMRSTERIGKAKTVTWEVVDAPSWEEVEAKLSGQKSTQPSAH